MDIYCSFRRIAFDRVRTAFLSVEPVRQIGKGRLAVREKSRRIIWTIVSLSLVLGVKVQAGEIGHYAGGLVNIRDVIMPPAPTSTFNENKTVPSVSATAYFGLTNKGVTCDHVAIGGGPATICERK